VLYKTAQLKLMILQKQRKRQSQMYMPEGTEDDTQAKNQPMGMENRVGKFLLIFSICRDHDLHAILSVEQTGIFVVLTQAERVQEDEEQGEGSAVPAPPPLEEEGKCSGKTAERCDCAPIFFQIYVLCFALGEVGDDKKNHTCAYRRTSHRRPISLRL
jgi:hypothetical protein